MMNVIINETGEKKTLSITNADGIDWVLDLIGNAGDLNKFDHDKEKDVYRTDENTYDWWAEYIENEISDQVELAELREEYDGDDIDKIIEDEWTGCGNDYNEHHDINQRVIERIKSEAEHI